MSEATDSEPRTSAERGTLSSGSFPSASAATRCATGLDSGCAVRPRSLESGHSSSTRPATPTRAWRSPPARALRWVATQLSHSSPMVTLQSYVHAMREEEADLQLAIFGAPEAPSDGSKRPIRLRSRRPKHARPLTHREDWWSWGESNPRPSDCQPDALPAELQPHGRARLPPGSGAVKASGARPARLDTPTGVVFFAAFGRSGGIGIRRALKRPRPHGRVGSSPTSGTQIRWAARMNTRTRPPSNSARSAPEGRATKGEPGCASS